MRSGWLVIAGVLGAIGVGMGAFGAHGLSETLTRLSADSDPSAEDIKHLIETRYEPAVLYHLLHVLAIAIVACIHLVRPSISLHFANAMFTAGILLFSGLLYWMTFSDIKALGAVVPLGGLAFILGWMTLAIYGIGRYRGDATSPAASSTF